MDVYSKYSIFKLKECNVKLLSFVNGISVFKEVHFFGILTVSLKLMKVRFYLAFTVTSRCTSTFFQR